MYKYEIAGKVYIQNPLVLGQIRQLMHLLEGLKIPREIDTLGLIAILGGKISQAIAIVITLEGTSPKEKDISVFASEIEFELSPDITMQVIEDFFDCNPIPLILERLGKIAEAITKKMQIGSKSSASSSQGETSLKEMPSSGDILQKTADPISNIAQEI